MMIGSIRCLCSIVALKLFSVDTVSPSYRRHRNKFLYTFLAPKLTSETWEILFVHLGASFGVWEMQF